MIALGMEGHFFFSALTNGINGSFRVQARAAAAAAILPISLAQVRRT
jgi:hypothetical protein